MAFLFLWFYRIVGGLTIAAGLFVLVSQTEWFREWFRDVALNMANDALLGELHVEDIRIDIFRGIVIEKPVLLADSTTVLTAESIEIQYDLAALLERVAAINTIDIIRPKINLLRSADGVWNFTQIVAPSEDDGTESDPPNGTFLVRELRIVDGELKVDDLGNEPWTEDHFVPTNLEIKDLQLSLSARVHLKDEDIYAAVNHMSFEHVNGPVDLQDLQLGVRATPAGIDVESLHIRLPRSEVYARVSMDSVNIFGGLDSTKMHDHPFRGHVTTDMFYGPDLHYFIPDINLKGSYTLDIDAEFDGDDLVTRNMRLTAGDAVINGRVRITDIDGSAPLGLDIEIFNSQARYADVRRRIVMVDLPELPFLTRSYLDHVKLRGHPDDSLWFEVQGRDRGGSIDGQMTLYLSQPTLGYQVDMALKEGDLRMFSDSGGVSSNINGRVMMVGSGVTLQELKGTTQIELDRSRLMGRPVKKFRAIIHGDGAGHIRVDTIFADVTPFVDDSLASTDPMFDFDTPRQVMALNALINVEDPDVPKYSGNVSLEGVDFSTLFADEALPHMISADLALDVSGLDIDSIQGSVEGVVNGLALRDRALLPFSIEMRSERSSSFRSFGLETSFGHVFIDGDFAPSALISAIGKTTESVIGSISQRARAITQLDAEVTTSPLELEPFRAHIDIDLLEASPLNLLLPDAYISGQAMLDATVRAAPEEVEITVDSMRVAEFSLTADSLSLYADPTRVQGSVLVQDLQTSPTVTAFNVNGYSDSLVRVNDMLIVMPRVDIATEGIRGKVKLSASSGLDEMRFAVNATISEKADQQTTLEFDTLNVALDPKRSLAWRLMRPTTVEVDRGSATFDGFTFLRIDGEEIQIDGTISDEHFDDARVQIKNFPLRDVRRFADVPPDNPIALVGGMVDIATINVSGTWKEPKIEVDMSASNVSYNRTPIGSLSLKMAHADRRITGSAIIESVDSTTTDRPLDLTVRSFPIDLAFAEVEDRLVPGEPIDVEVEANDLAMAAIEPFLPAVERVQGTADAKMTMTGTFPNDVKLAGTANYTNARFLSSSTNMAYSSSGTLHLDGSYLYLDSISLRNMRRDLRNGHAQGTGIVHFNGLEVDSINLELTTPESSPGIKILNSASQARSPKVYGDLIVRSGTKPINLYGRLDEPHLDGDLVVRLSDIVLPEERSSTKARKTSFKYLRKDTTQYDDRSIFDFIATSEGITQSLDSTDDTETLELAGDTKSGFTDFEETKQSNFVDDLEFNLDVYIEGRTILTMIFGTFEILRADLAQADRKIPMNFSGSFGDNSTELRGKVLVKEGASTYKFYKPFNTWGELDFGNGGLTNPDLKLVAVHEGRRFINDKPEDFKVELTITGSKEAPNLSYRVWRNEREVQGDSAKIASDALMLILVGRTQDELFQSGQGDLVGQANSALSAVATNALGDVLSGIGSIQSTELDLGSDLSTSRITVSGQIFGDVTYRVSGQISDLSGNSTFTLSMPLSVLADEEALRYLRADFSSTVNNAGNVTRLTRLWEIKLGARLP